MFTTGKLKGLTIFITGASCGIGKAIALKVAQDGANVIIASNATNAHHKLSGTIYETAKEIEALDAHCLPCILDVRDEGQVKAAVDKAVQLFGGIDILVNNASSISLTDTIETTMKKFDMLHDVNVRGAFLLTKVCLPYLKKSEHAHILMLSPPLRMSSYWFKRFLAYTMSQYAMSLCVLGMHEEFRAFGIAVNALWPRTIIRTAGIEVLPKGMVALYSRKPEIMADAAYLILQQNPRTCSGNFFIDQELLMQHGIKEFDDYAYDEEKNNELYIDVFVDMDENPSLLISKL